MNPRPNFLPISTYSESFEAQTHLTVIEFGSHSLSYHFL
jgi:hypothetical protein